MALAAAKAAVRSLPRRLRSQANTRSVGRRAAQAVMNITKMHFFLAFSEAPHTWAAAAFGGDPLARHLKPRLQFRTFVGATRWVALDPPPDAETGQGNASPLRKQP